MGMITKGDIDLIKHIAIFRVITVKQLAAISQRTIQVIRRRLRFLESEYLIETNERGLRKGPGRRENILFLTNNGIQFLKKQNGIDTNSIRPIEKIDEFLFLDHNLLVNWFFIHLIQIKRDNSRLAIMHRITNIRQIQKGNSDSIPDGVFFIKDKESGKSLLFFLEVDMGTETLVSKDRHPSDVRQKIVNYQRVFQTGRYRYYNNFFNASFNGFRMLFLTATSKRLKSLCNLTQEMQPSNFIWLTDQKQMFTHGLSADIWIRGGHQKKGAESILGSRFSTISTVIDKIK